MCQTLNIHQSELYVHLSTSLCPQVQITAGITIYILLHYLHVLQCAYVPFIIVVHMMASDKNWSSAPMSSSATH